MNKRIAVLGATLFAVGVLAVSVGSTNLSAATASKLDVEKYLTVDHVELYEVVQGKAMFVDRQPFAEPTGVPVPGPINPKGTTIPTIPGSTTGGIDLGQIIALGEKIWAIIEKNKPVVVQNYTAVSAVPAGIKTWEELGEWSEPAVRLYKLSYVNKFNMHVVDFNFRVAYTYNGNYDGKGKYLSRVEIDPAVLNVAWGYKFNASGEALNIVNAGTKDAPMAAMEIRLNWSVDTVLKHMQESVRFYMRGDGLFKNLSDGNQTPSVK